MTVIGNLVVRLFAQNATDGAAPTLFAATAPIPGGSYAGPSSRREMTGPPILVGRSPAASDLPIATRLWNTSKELTRVSYPTSQLRVW